MFEEVLDAQNGDNFLKNPKGVYNKEIQDKTDADIMLEAFKDELKEEQEKTNTKTTEEIKRLANKILSLTENLKEEVQKDINLKSQEILWDLEYIVSKDINNSSDKSDL